MLRASAPYVGNPGYRVAIVEGEPRIDLNGNAAGAVTASEAEYARQRAQKP